MAEDYTYTYTSEIISGEIEYPPQWVRDYINTQNLANVVNGVNDNSPGGWGYADVSFNYTDTTNPYGQGIYKISVSQKRNKTGSSHMNAPVVFDGDTTGMYYNVNYRKGWQTANNNSNDANNDNTNADQLNVDTNLEHINYIDLENGNVSGTISGAVLTIEFPEAFVITKYDIWSNDTLAPSLQYLFGYDETNSTYNKLHEDNYAWPSDVHTPSVRTNAISQTTQKSYKKYAITAGNYHHTIWSEVRFYGNRVIMGAQPVTFNNNILTIENSIDANDIDPVSFVLPVGYSMSNLNVTNFSGTGTVTYTISTDGATDITGTFTAKDINILDGTPIFAIATDTTYNLTLTADATITYRIVGTKLDTMSSTEYSISQLITAGYTQQQLIDGNFWIADDSANRFLPIYNNNVFDVSGGNMIVRDNFIMGSGNIDLSNVLIKQSSTIDADITVNNNLFVTGDVSMGTVGLNVAGDVTIDGNLSVESYTNNSISPSAVKSDADGSITESNMTAIMNDSSYDKLQMNGDVSLNATISTPGYTSTIDSLTFPLDFTNESKMVAGTNTSHFGSSEKPVRINNTGNVIVTINSSKKMAYSVDYGDNWSTYNTNVIAVNVSGDGNYICVVTTSNIYISSDTGSTWSNPAGFSTTVGHIVSDTCLSYDGQYIFVMGGIEGSKTAVRSTDYGASFANAGYTLDRGYNNYVLRASAAISDTGEYIMVSTENAVQNTTPNDHSHPGNAVYASSDYGANFTLHSPSVFSWLQQSLSVMSHDGQYQLAQAKTGRGSYNFGETWGRSAGSGLSGNFSKYPYTICRSHANVHITANDTDPNMFISIDGGSSFSIMSNTNMNTVVGATYQKYHFTANANGSLIYFNTSDGRVGRLHVPGVGYTPPVYQASSDKVTYFGASTKLKLTNGIQLSDNTIVNTTNISSGTYATNDVVFKPSHFDNMTVTGDFASNPPLSASDYRIKTNIQELDETHTIDKLRPVTYYQTQMKKNAIGFIAHELQEYYPELVEGEKDGDKMQSVNYTGILAILINEIKNLKQKIKDTRNTLSSQNTA